MLSQLNAQAGSQSLPLHESLLLQESLLLHRAVKGAVCSTQSQL